MHRSIDDHNLYNLFIWTKDYRKIFTTRYWLKIVHMTMFVVKSNVIQIDSQGYGSVN